MEDKKRDKIILIVQSCTAAGYILFILASTIGKYFKEVKKNIKKEAKRKDKLNKYKYRQKKKKMKSRKK